MFPSLSHLIAGFGQTFHENVMRSHQSRQGSSKGHKRRALRWFRIELRFAGPTFRLNRMRDATQLLHAMAAGDRQAARDLLPLVYDELRELAAARMAVEAAQHTLNPTALVHEAYLRLIGPVDAEQWHHRGHFFAAAAEAMRRVLVDHARNRSRLKRGGGRTRVDLDQLTDVTMATDDDLIDLDDALSCLAEQYPVAAELVKLRFFAGMTLTESATALGLSERTADRYWQFARAWLATALTCS